MSDRPPFVDVPGFVARCDAYCVARDIKRPTLSKLLFNDSTALSRLAERGGLTVHLLNRAHERLVELETQLAAREAPAVCEGASL